MVRARSDQKRIDDATALVAPLLHCGLPSIDALIAKVAEIRGRRVRILEIDLPAGGPSGHYVRTASEDLLIVQKEAPRLRRALILAHELGHMLMEHEGALTVEESAVLVSSIPHELRARYLSRQGYVDHQEREAEEFATVVVSELTRLEDVVRARLQ